MYTIIVFSTSLWSFFWGYKYGRYLMRKKIVETIKEAPIIELKDNILTIDGEEYELISEDDEYEMITEMPEYDEFGVPIIDKKERKPN